MTAEICGDNRFEIIDKAKKHLLEATNIDTSKEEMAVLDSFLFRCWQMGWLDKYDASKQVTSKLKKPCDSLLTDDSDGDKESKSKLEPSKVDYRTDKSANIGTEVNDLISRADVHKTLSLLATEGGADAKMLLMDAHEFIDALPSADRPQGEWEIEQDDDGMYGNCSICGNDADFEHYRKPYNYCPNCGARMRGAE